MRAPQTIIPFLALLISACASDGSDLPQPQEGNAYLTIVGDRNVFIEAGTRQTITVKYHDLGGQALAGRVTFAFQGTAAGATLTDDSGVTNGDGEVSIEVVGGDEAAFRIRAEAEYAAPVEWAVAVSNDPPLPPLNLSGRYQMESQFNLAAGVPGPAGDVLRTFIELTDGPNDPATWVIDQMVGDSRVSDFIRPARPLIDVALNELFRAIAPDFVDNMIAIGDDFGQAATKFGIVSTLDVSESAGGYTAQHTIDGFFFTIDSVKYEYSLAELSLSPITIDDVGVTLSGQAISIADHQLPVSYGSLMLFALNQIVIPNIDPFAGSLAELLINQADCYSVGYKMVEEIGLGTPGLYEAVCETGITAAALVVEGEIRNIDSIATAIAVHGEARAGDLDGDRMVDKITAGLWEGTMTFGPLSSALAKPEQKFAGERMP